MAPGPTARFGGNPFGNNGSGLGGSGAQGLGQLGRAQQHRAIAAKVSPALVDIATDLTYQHGEAVGTGIVLTSDGLVLTNNHVISGATQVRVTDVGNSQTYTGSVVGYDRAHDVAVVQLQNASGLPHRHASATPRRCPSATEIVGLGNAGGVGRHAEQRRRHGHRPGPIHHRHRRRRRKHASS